MGYNGPAPGVHIENDGIPVLTAIVYSKNDIPKPGDSFPDDPRWVAGKATRIEQIRPNAWSVDIPYIWALNRVEPDTGRSVLRTYELTPANPVARMVRRMFRR